MNTANEKDPLEMSDEEALNMSAPPVGAVSTEQPDDPEEEEEKEEVEELEPEEKEEPEPEEKEEPEEKPDEPNPLADADDKIGQKPAEPEKKDVPPDDKKPVEDPAKKTEPPVEGDSATKPDESKKPVEEPAPLVLSLEQKAEAFDKLMNFRANGKDIKLNSIEEAVKLQQMGANYTKRLQQLQPVMRLHKMLENNKLLDPNELSYLIDLHQKKPEAIQKLLADSKFDPLTIDAEQAAQYKPTNHQVSDTEVQFDQVLKEVEASQTGRELVTEIAEQWDQESRRALYREPRLLAALNEQRSLGLYGIIQSEIERRRMLGDLQGVSFLVAYDQIGAELAKSGQLKRPGQVVQQPKEPESQKKPDEPVEVRTKVPAPKVKASDKAKAASAPKTNPGTKVNEEPNFLDMPDTQFLQEFEGRL